VALGWPIVEISWLKSRCVWIARDAARSTRYRSEDILYDQRSDSISFLALFSTSGQVARVDPSASGRVYKVASRAPRQLNPPSPSKHERSPPFPIRRSPLTHTATCSISRLHFDASTRSASTLASPCCQAAKRSSARVTPASPRKFASRRPTNPSRPSSPCTMHNCN
jgi:hypothetical protein